MKKECFSFGHFAEQAKKHKVPLSPAVKANGFVFVSGMPPLDDATGEFLNGDIGDQTRCCMEKIRMALEAAGSSLDKIVKCTLMADDVAHYQAINAAYAEFFESDPPARTFITVAAWPMDFNVEIECIALE